MLQSTITILHAEDDDGHAMLLERNLERGGFQFSFRRVRDGQEALDFLRGEGEFTDRIVSGPLLLVLDMKMPRKDGVETLQSLRSDPAFSHIPVIILTTTDDPREILRCYQNGCNVYMSKPVEYQTFIEAVQRLASFIEHARFPESNLC